MRKKDIQDLCMYCWKTKTCGVWKQRCDLQDRSEKGKVLLTIHTRSCEYFEPEDENDNIF